jgi:hypothetical protein
MAEAVSRMNRAVEMVADAESRAAAAAAMATAYRDISDGQAAAAATAADVQELPPQAQGGHIANLQQVLHAQLFSVRTVLSDVVSAFGAAVAGVVAWLQALLAGAGASVANVFGGGGGGSSGGSAAAGGGGGGGTGAAAAP